MVADWSASPFSSTKAFSRFSSVRGYPVTGGEDLTYPGPIEAGAVGGFLYLGSPCPAFASIAFILRE